MTTRPPFVGWSTATLEPIAATTAVDPTLGLVLIYARHHASLPAVVLLSKPTTTIGREGAVDVCIPEAAVSRVHARIELRGGEATIVDAGSTNGTLVAGRRVQEHRLSEHDVVRIGDSVFRFAAAGASGYAPYRIDGSVVDPSRAVRAPSELVGGYQIDCLRSAVGRIAGTGLSCVIRGESGTGKELVARAIHTASGRRGPLVALNCAAIPATLLESELFGYRKGAFTGAAHDKAGFVKAANGGTLFLDEIGDMPLDAQAKLLRVVQEREVVPIGATQAERVDVRFLCATHRDLDAAVAAGTFRGDLLARLREFVVRVPPLRERLEDLLPLTQSFIARSPRPTLRVSSSFMLALAHHTWPYNVRELESAVKLAVALCTGDELGLVHLPESVRDAVRGHGGAAPSSTTGASPSRAAPSRSPSGTAPSEAELRALCLRHRGNVSALAKELGKERMQIHRWLKRYGIDIEQYR